MNIILLSGGSGKRLWPLSNDIRARQFIKLFKKPDHSIPMGAEDGDYESMLQRTYRQIKTVDPEARITVATSKAQVSAIHNQLGEAVEISAEPSRKDTFPAIALASAYLHDIQGVNENEAVVVCPVDTYVDDEYFNCLQGLYEAAQQGEKKLILMGIQPTYPSEKYGYIRPATDDGENYYFTVTEKPNSEIAKEYIESGALWNGGVFAFRLAYILEQSQQLLGGCDYQYLLNHYEEFDPISFDFAVVEKEKSIEVLRYSGTWKDLGTWNTLTEAMEGTILGNVRINDLCSNVHIINELGIPILGMGLHDLVVSASPEGILVSDKEQSSYIKPFIDDITQQIMYAEKSWGSYRVLDVEEESMTIKVTLNPGHRMNYHSHEKRDEIWNVINGEGTVVINGNEETVSPGDIIKMKKGTKHMVIAGKYGLQIIEIQLGKDITEKDKKIHFLA